MPYRIRRIFQCPGGNYCFHLQSKSDMNYLPSSTEKGTTGETERHMQFANRAPKKKLTFFGNLETRQCCGN